MEPLRLITQPESWAKEAQPNIIEVLEDWLRRAKDGELVGVALAGECIDGMTITCITPTKHRGMLLGAVSQVQYRLNKVMDEA